jgi:hypothetical protein
MFVGSLPFLVSASRKIKFMTMEYVPRILKPIINKSLNKISLHTKIMALMLALH